MRIPILEAAKWTADLVALRQAVTLKNFDASSFATQTDTSDIVADIADAAFALEDSLERQYLARYPAKFPFFAINFPG